MKIITKRLGLAVAVLGLLTVAAGQARATLIVDQSFVGYSNLGAALAEGYAFVGQTVTTGVTGSLVAVELEASRSESFLTPWILDIQVVSGGLPTGVVLSTTTINPSNFPTSRPFPPTTPLPLVVNLATSVFLNAGDQFAIVLHPQGATGSPSLWAGTWSGTTGNAYAGGTMVLGMQANSLTSVGSDLDLYFRTIVDTTPLVPTPEPSTLALVFTALPMGLGLAWKRRRKAVTA